MNTSMEAVMPCCSGQITMYESNIAHPLCHGLDECNPVPHPFLDKTLNFHYAVHSFGA
jgi:hypothetical protein